MPLDHDDLTHIQLVECLVTDIAIHCGNEIVHTYTVLTQLYLYFGYLKRVFNWHSDVLGHCIIIVHSADIGDSVTTTNDCLCVLRSVTWALLRP